jgi:hypothetical protein
LINENMMNFIDHTYMSQYTIDDYIEAKSFGADIHIPEYDQIMNDLKIGEYSMSEWCNHLHAKNNYQLPDFKQYLENYAKGTIIQREPIYDKIISELILTTSCPK